MKSENTDEIKVLKEALKREQQKNARLKAKHDADKAEIRKLKRCKDPKPAVPSTAAAKAKPLSAKKKSRCSGA